LPRLVGVIRKQARNAEVEQPHLAAVGDEDVAGLEVAVDHQPGVRVLHGVQHLGEQGQALSQAQPAGITPGVDGLAVHTFHRQPGCAVVGHTGVVQARDVRVLQPRQDVLLTGETFGQA
jgi:hypothetical protein